MSSRLLAVMEALYDSEINCGVESFWDGGWRVSLGDEMNGIKCTEDFKTSELNNEAAAWLETMARQFYPNSNYAKSALRSVPDELAGELVKLLAACRDAMIEAADGPTDWTYMIAAINHALSRQSSSDAGAVKKWCFFCQVNTHNDAECWSTRPAGWKPTQPLILPPGIASPTPSASAEEIPEEIPLEAQRQMEAENTESIHQCRDCGTYWRLWHGNGGWSLADAKQKPGKCCDNSEDFQDRLIPSPLPLTGQAQGKKP